MPIIPTSTGRATIQDRGAYLRVILPARRSVFVIVFLAAWLTGWYFGESAAILELLSESSRPWWFIIPWLTGWSLAGLVAILLLLWLVIGRETIELRRDAVRHRHTIFGLGLTRMYDLAQVTNLRVGPESTRTTFDDLRDRSPRESFLAKAGAMWGLAGGPIVFDWGERTIRCGTALDEAEAQVVIEHIWHRSPRLRGESAAPQE